MRNQEVIRKIADIPAAIDKIAADTLLEYATKIYNEALARVPAGATGVRSSFNLTVSDSGLRVSIWTNNEMAAYVEFGTGEYAGTYLSGKPQEMVDEAIKFFVNGRGITPAQPYLFPAYYNHRDEIITVMDQRIQKYFDSI